MLKMRILTCRCPPCSWMPILLLLAMPSTVPFFPFNAWLSRPCRWILLPTCRVEVWSSSSLLASIVSLVQAHICWCRCRGSSKFSNVSAIDINDSMSLRSVCSRRGPEVVCSSWQKILTALCCFFRAVRLSLEVV